eukprot:627938_1
MDAFFRFGPNSANQNHKQQRLHSVIMRVMIVKAKAHKYKINLQYINESLQQEMNVKRHGNMDTMDCLEDRYYHRGLIALDDPEKEGYYAFQSNILIYLIFSYFILFSCIPRKKK